MSVHTPRYTHIFSMALRTASSGTQLASSGPAPQTPNVTATLNLPALLLLLLLCLHAAQPGSAQVPDTLAPVLPPLLPEAWKQAHKC